MVIDDALGDEVRITVIAAGFDGGAPKRVEMPVIDASALGGHANPLDSDDPIAVALDIDNVEDTAEIILPKAPRKLISFEADSATDEFDEIDVPDFMK